MTTPRIEERVDEFLALLMSQGLDRSFAMLDARSRLINELKYTKEQAHQAGIDEMAEHIIGILKQSHLLTNGYKDTDVTRTAMYIENEAFNIAINKRLDFFIEQIEALKDNKD